MINLDHIDPGNSGGSVQIPDTHFDFKPRKITYSCPVCNDVFESENERRQHRISQHPIKRPYLYIKGKSPRHDEVMITSKLDNSDYYIEDADIIELDGKVYTKSNDAIFALVASQKGIKKVVLKHQGYTVNYQLIFNIPNEETLLKVEEYFYDTFSSSIPMARQLELFNEKVHTLEHDALIYAGALGCYISAIMAKDRMPDAAITFDDHVNKLGEAQDKLESFSRPLAKYIESIIGFMLNDFSDESDKLSPPSIQISKDFFRTGILLSNIKHNNIDKNYSIPVDAITEKLTMFCVEEESYRIAELPNMHGLYNATSISQKDKIKILLILWAMSRHLSDIESEAKYQKQLIHTSLFSELINSTQDS